MTSAREEAEVVARLSREHGVSEGAVRTVFDALRRGGGSIHHAGSWWPQELGNPSSVGSRNDMRYAVFSVERRLVIDDHGQTTIYDTGDHQISGVSQAQNTVRRLVFGIGAKFVASVQDVPPR